MERIKDRYTITERLGEGGMGVVFAAHDKDLDRMVAVKALSSELCSNEEAVRIFEGEAKIMARIRHSNIVSVYDVVREHGRSFLVMEHIEGSTVEQIIRLSGPRIALDKAIDITLQLLAGLAYLHDQGIIHRDIKPSNLMVDLEGSVRLMDFGLARSLRTLIQKGTRVRGTPAYMAPEQIQGGTLSCASDLYAVGVTLFELLTGRLPFQGDDLAYHHVHTPAPDVRTLRPDIPVVVALLIGTCLQKDPNSRPPTARAMMQDLVEGAGVHSQAWPSSVISALDLGPLRSSGAFAQNGLQSGLLAAPHSDPHLSQPRLQTHSSPAFTAPAPQSQNGGRTVAVAAILAAIIVAAGGLATALVLRSAPPVQPNPAAAVTQAPALPALPEPKPDTPTIEPVVETPPPTVEAPPVEMAIETPEEDIKEEVPAVQTPSARDRRNNRAALARRNKNTPKPEPDIPDEAPEPPVDPVAEAPEPAPAPQAVVEAEKPKAAEPPKPAPPTKPASKARAAKTDDGELPLGLGGAGQKKPAKKTSDKDKNAPASEKTPKARPYGF